MHICLIKYIQCATYINVVSIVMSRSSHPGAKRLDMKLRCRFVQEEGNKTTIPRAAQPPAKSLY